MQKILIFITTILLQFLVTNSFASDAVDEAVENAVENQRDNTNISKEIPPIPIATEVPNLPDITVPIITEAGDEGQVSEIFHERNGDQYFDWSFNINKQGSKNLCYITATAIKKSEELQNRGEPYFVITKTKGKLPEVSVSSGYYYKKDSELELSFGLQKFYLLTFKNKAWTYSIDDDIEVIKSMRDSDSVVATATSVLNQSSRDTYSLIGFNKAFQRLQNECK